MPASAGQDPRGDGQAGAPYLGDDLVLRGGTPPLSRWHGGEGLQVRCVCVPPDYMLTVHTSVGSYSILMHMVGRYAASYRTYNDIVGHVKLHDDIHKV